MDVLFLTVSTGSGHIKAAEALAECVRDRYPGARILSVDALKYANPIADRIIAGGYLETVRRVPGIYGRLYRAAETSRRLTGICKTVNMAFSFRLSKIIDDFQPSIIVCTHTVPLHMLSYLKRHGRVNAPVAAVVTDFASHLFWKLDNIDAYIVPHDTVARDMAQMGLRAESIVASGIPVKRCFLSSKEKRAARQELGLEDATTLLIMGGSMGLGDVPAVFRSLLACSRQLQLVVITGSNRKLKRELESYPAPAGKLVRILGYSQQVQEYMDASDLLITKPGGMTVSEALVKSLPMVVLSPLPGQEERNAEFLLGNGAAVTAAPGRDMELLLNYVLDDASVLSRMKEAAKRLARPFASDAAVSLLENLALGIAGQKSAVIRQAGSYNIPL